MNAVILNIVHHSRCSNGSSQAVRVVGRIAGLSADCDEKEHL